MPNDTNGFRAERDAIVKLRQMFPNMGAKTLARKIGSNDFVVGTDLFDLARSTNGRSVLSIYSVIRRYDAKQAVAA